jgi:chromosome segregation and condensation protein ScpB
MDIIFKKLPLKSKAALTSTNIQYKEAYLHEIPRAFADNFGIKTIDKLSIDIFC